MRPAPTATGRRSRSSEKAARRIRTETDASPQDNEAWGPFLLRPKRIFFFCLTAIPKSGLPFHHQDEIRSWHGERALAALKGCGPTFTLATWDPNRKGFGGKWIVGYRLTMHTTYWTSPPMRPVKTVHTVLFEGEDFGCSPMHAVDSDQAIEGIMSFLTLRLGDTDREYFAQYTPEQLDFCSQHAEALAAEVERRFNKKGR